MSENTNITKFSQELNEMISSIHLFLRSIMQQQPDDLTEGKVTMPQYLVLSILNTQQSLKMTNLAEILHISLPGVTGLVNRMVKMGLVQRTYQESDRRVIFIQLTSNGKQAVARIESARRKAIERIFINLSPEDREAYLNILRKIRKVLHEKDDEL